MTEIQKLLTFCEKSSLLRQIKFFLVINNTIYLTKTKLTILCSQINLSNNIPKNSSHNFSSTTKFQVFSFKIPLNQTSKRHILIPNNNFVDSNESKIILFTLVIDYEGKFHGNGLVCSRLSEQNLKLKVPKLSTRSDFIIPY